MARQAFVTKSFKEESLAKIAVANEIITRYLAAGLRLTLRQLYYQFVAHYGLPNNERSYQNLGTLISEGRLAGLIDWNAIEDRGRIATRRGEYDNIGVLAMISADDFRLPRWEDQDHYVELWVEKQALAGVLEPIADKYHLVLMVNKGYSSQSAMYASAARFIRKGKGKKSSVLLYLGDHDPSGEDMVRDIGDRLATFGVRGLQVTKVALTMDQIEEHKPPPNPTKLTDSRATAYIEKFGYECWEVDALDPTTLTELITENIKRYLNVARMNEVILREKKQRKRLRELVKSIDWEKV